MPLLECLTETFPVLGRRGCIYLVLRDFQHGPSLGKIAIATVVDR